MMDSVPLLVAAKGGFLPDVAGVAPLTVAEEVSSSDFSGSRPLLGWRPRSIVLGWCPRPNFLKRRSRP